MAKNWTNIYVDYAIHHITGTVHNWQPILLYQPILDIFYLEFNRLIIRWDIKLYAFIIMPEHFHLLAQNSTGDNVLKFLMGARRAVSGKARSLIEKNDKRLHDYYVKHEVNPESFYLKTAGKSEFRFWKEKPRVIPLTKPNHIKQKAEYIHNNPVRKGLCSSPENWEHSSYKCYYDQSLTGLPISKLQI